MTDFKSWNKKANDLVKDDKEEEEREKEISNKALGLKEGEVEGPPVAKLKEQMDEMKKLSDEKKKMLESMDAKEDCYDNFENNVKRASAGGKKEDKSGENSPSTSNIALSDCGNFLVLPGAKRGIKVRDCEKSKFKVSGSPLKIFLDASKEVTIDVPEAVQTSSTEIFNCQDCTLKFGGSMQSVQIDRCKRVVIEWTDELNMGFIVHQDTTDLTLVVAGHVCPKPVILDLEGNVAKTDSLNAEYQYITCFEKQPDGGRRLVSRIVTRTKEKEYPTFMAEDYSSGKGPQINPGEETVLTAGAANPAEALAKKELGNNAFRANDFMQAASFYSMSIAANEDPVVYGNRAQCWLKLGNFEKCEEDCDKGLKINGELPKLHFRKGMALHSRGEHMNALECLGRAEKLDPKNKQVTDAIGMVSIKMRKVREKEQEKYR